MDSKWLHVLYCVRTIEKLKPVLNCFQLKTVLNCFHANAHMYVNSPDRKQFCLQGMGVITLSHEQNCLPVPSASSWWLYLWCCLTVQCMRAFVRVLLSVRFSEPGTNTLNQGPQRSVWKVRHITTTANSNNTQQIASKLYFCYIACSCTVIKMKYNSCMLSL